MVTIFVTGHYTYKTWGMTGILEQLNWEFLKNGGKIVDLQRFKELEGAASIPTNDLVPPNRRTRTHNSLIFQSPLAGTDIYKSSFSPPPPPTIRD